MVSWKKLSVGAALAAGLAAAVAGPAQGAGDTGRTHGCAAHWRVTATWNECENAPGVNVQLQVNCGYAARPVDYYSSWVYVSGNKSPVSRYECIHRADDAWNAFRF